MTLQLQKNNQIIAEDEHILVVKRKHLFQHEDAWQGLNKTKDFSQYLDIIQTHQEFLPRSAMETDPTYKQIIPYLVFTHENRYFLMQRQSKATEQRLKNKYSLGIGGHIRVEDLTEGHIIDWARREFHEEVSYNDGLTIEPLGILNDDSTDVGKVHIGFVFLLHGNSENITVKSELKSGTLLTLEECESFYDSMETWSQLVMNAL